MRTHLISSNYRLAVLFLAFFPAALHAGKASARFSHLDLNDGLAHMTVYAIHQDRYGYLWFGTENGLNRFDGHRFLVFRNDPKDLNSLSDDNISSIVEDKEGFLWLGTWGGGLNRFDAKTLDIRRFQHDPDREGGLSSNYIQSLYCAPDGILWLGTRRGGLGRFDPRRDHFATFRHDPNEPTSLSADRVWCIVPDARGHIWLGTDKGLDRFDPRGGKVKRFLNGQPLGSVPVRALGVRGDTLLIGTTRGLATMDLQTEEWRFIFSGVEQSNWVNVLCHTDQNDWWVGTLDGGLRRLDSKLGTWTRFVNDPIDPNSLSANDVRALLIDNSKNLWVGTRGGGLTRMDLKRTKFETDYHRPGQVNSLGAGEIRALAVASENIIWSGSQHTGLTRIDRAAGLYKNYRHDPDDQKSLSHDRIFSLLLDREKRLWVGTYQGLNRMNPDGSFTLEAGFEKNTITTLLQDRSGVIWIGTQSGLARSSDASFVHLAPRGLAEGRVNALYEDHKGVIWIGGTAYGLARYTPTNNRFQLVSRREKTPASFSENVLFCLEGDGDILWIGSNGGGLTRRAPDGSYRSYLVDDGLPNNVVLAILREERGYLWLSTNKGMSRFEPDTEQFRNYDVFDGLQGDQFSWGSRARGANSELFFGGANGFTAFVPRNVLDYPLAPSIVLSELRSSSGQVFRHLENNADIYLSGGQNGIALTFSALDYTRPGKNRYSWYLEGLDEGWGPVSEARSLSYNNLKRGKYTFRVRGSNHDGIWNNEGTSFNIVIEQTFIERWRWQVFAAGLVFVFLILVYALLRYRQAKQAEVSKHKRKEKLAVEANLSKNAFLAFMSHELRTPLNAIIGFSEIMEEEMEDFEPGSFEPEQFLSDVKKIKSNAYQQLIQVNNLLELTRLESGKEELYIETFDVRTMVASVLHHVEPMLQKTRNKLEVRYLPEELGEMTADNIKVQSILINLLTNANNTTRKGLITLCITRHADREINFQIQDTGSGMTHEKLSMLYNSFAVDEKPDSDDGGGLGLYISNQFSKLMGGEIGVESQLSKGSTFSVKLPVKVTSRPEE